MSSLPLYLFCLVLVANSASVAAQCDGNPLILEAPPYADATLNFTIIPQNSTNLNCRWVFSRITQGKNLRIEFTNFDLQQSDQCVADGLSAYVGVTDELPSTFMGRWCGRTVARLLQVPTLRLDLTTDGYVPSGGFSLKYRIAYSDVMDGRELTAGQPDLWYSYRYGVFQGGDNVGQRVTFLGPSSSVVQVEVVSNDFTSTACNFNYLRFDDDEGTIVCGANTTAKFIRSSGKILVMTYAQNERLGKGISLRYSSRSKESPVITNGVQYINATHETTLFDSFRSNTTSLEIEARGDDVIVLQAITPSANEFLPSNLSLALGSNGDVTIKGDYSHLDFLPRLSIPGNMRIIIPDSSNASRFTIKTFTQNVTSTLELTTVFSMSYVIISLSATSTVRLTTLHPEAFQYLEVVPLDAAARAGAGSSSSRVWTLRAGYNGEDGDVAPLPAYPGETTRYRRASRYLLLQPQSSPQAAGAFLLRYMLVQAPCTLGQVKQVNATEGYLHSPNYPLPYFGRDVPCSWRLTASDSQARVRLVLETVSLETTGACLAVHDGANSSSPALTSCSVTSQGASPETWVSRGRDLFVIFTPGSTDNQSGLFRFKYSSFDPNSCSAQLQVTSSKWNSWQTPGYPESYANSQECRATFTSPTQQTVTVEVTDSDVADNTATCTYDKATATDTGGRELGRWCGSSLPSYTSYTAPQGLSFTLVSNASVTGKGFSARYRQGCAGDGQVAVKQAGNFSSPGYPESFLRGVQCTWQLTSANGMRLNLSDVTLSGDCSQENVTIHDGEDATSPPAGTWCGGGQAGGATELQSWGQKLTVVLHSSTSSGQTAPRRVLLNFAPSASKWSAACRAEGREITASSSPQPLFSPDYPRPYQAPASGLHCTWKIRTVPGGHLVLQVQDLNLGSSEDSLWCSSASFFVYEVFNTTRTLIGQFCGTSKPTYKSSGGSLDLVLATPTFLRGVTFMVQYHNTSDSAPVRDCGSYIYLDGETTLSSPGYSSQNLKPGDCWWRVSAPEGQLVSVQSQTFSLQPRDTDGGPCSLQFLRLYDGWHENDVILGTFCGRTEVRSLSTRNNLTLLLHSTSASSSQDGFVLRLKNTPDPLECIPGKTVNVTAAHTPVFLKSPRYPRNYASNLDCYWRIDASNSEKIELKTVDMSLQEDGDRCSKDFVEVQDVSTSQSSHLGRWCGDSRPTVQSLGSALRLHFRSDASENFRGFRIQVLQMRENPEAAKANAGLIVGVVFAVLIAIGIAVAAVFGLRWYRGRQKTPATSSRHGNGFHDNPIPMTELR